MVVGTFGCPHLLGSILCLLECLILRDRRTVFLRGGVWRGVGEMPNMSSNPRMLLHTLCSRRNLHRSFLMARKKGLHLSVDLLRKRLRVVDHWGSEPPWWLLATSFQVWQISDWGWLQFLVDWSSIREIYRKLSESAFSGLNFTLNFQRRANSSSSASRDRRKWDSLGACCHVYLHRISK